MQTPRGQSHISRSDTPLRLICSIKLFTFSRLNPKNNLAPESSPVGFKFGANGFEWIGRVSVYNNELLSGQYTTTEKDNIGFSLLYDKINNMLANTEKWNGTATELAAELELDVAPKALSQKMNKLTNKFKLHGIIYEMKCYTLVAVGKRPKI